MLRLLPLLAAALALGGCIEHEARLAPSDPSAAAALGVHQTARTPTEPVRSAQPVDLPATAWKRAPDGTRLRGDVRVLSPLPWWERFPIDLIADLAPVTCTCSATGDLALAPIPIRSDDDLAAEARTAGFAGPARTDPTSTP